MTRATPSRIVDHANGREGTGKKIVYVEKTSLHRSGKFGMYSVGYAEDNTLTRNSHAWRADSNRSKLIAKKESIYVHTVNFF